MRDGCDGDGDGMGSSLRAKSRNPAPIPAQEEGRSREGGRATSTRQMFRNELRCCLDKLLGGRAPRAERERGVNDGAREEGD